jgi:hypothetical protein
MSQPKVETVVPRRLNLHPGPGHSYEEISGPNLSIDHVQIAVPVPGHVPCFALVNDGNCLYIIRRSDKQKGWEAAKFGSRLGSDRNEDRWHQKIACAVPDINSIVTFHISQGQGHITTYNASEPQSSNVEAISLDDFIPQH